MARQRERRERLLVNFFYAHPVGHAIEALHYCSGYHAADPARDVALALNASTAVRLADFCPFVERVFAIDHPFVEHCDDSLSRLEEVPRYWDWIVDDARRHQPLQRERFAGLRTYYEASDRHLVALAGRGTSGSSPPSYLPHRPLRLELPESARAVAARRLGEGRSWIAVMPTGSGDRALYPSAQSWLVVLDALAAAFPDTGVALTGKLAADRQTASSLTRGELERLLAHRSRPLNCFDIDLAEQLAVVTACRLFVAPHTGFGMAALAVGTPWLAISGGRYFEYFFNHVPFRSVIPDVERYPCFTQMHKPSETIDDDGEGRRTTSMTRRRIVEDLDRIVAAAEELLSGSLTYEQALKDYFTALLEAFRGDASSIWSIDDVHLDYLPGRQPKRP